MGLRVLVGCEESGVVRDAFGALGHDAWSNDKIPSRRGGQHLQKDVLDALVDDGPWDIVILHPECTCLAVSGNSTYGIGMPRHSDRLAAIEWTVGLWRLAVSIARVGVCLENPVGVIPTSRTTKPVYIHPWQHGHPEQKKTGLWLDRLPPLRETKNVYNEMILLPKHRRERLHYMGPSPTRKRDRSETYQGIAAAMASQWGG